VGLGPTTVVRLESALAHEDLRYWSGPGGLLSAWAAEGQPQSAGPSYAVRAKAILGGVTGDPGRHGHAKTADRPVPRYASAHRRVKPAATTRHTHGMDGANSSRSG
jgi:hypothetical protein